MHFVRQRESFVPYSVGQSRTHKAKCSRRYWNYSLRVKVLSWKPSVLIDSRTSSDIGTTMVNLRTPRQHQTAHNDTTTGPKSSQTHLLTSRVKEAIPKIAKVAPSEASQFGLETANYGLKTAFFTSVKLILMKMTQNSALNEGFDCTIERWTQSSTFMDAFARLALALF